jgi:thiol:disulfide interchange protein
MRSMVWNVSLALAVGAVGLLGPKVAQAKSFNEIATVSLTVEPSTVVRGQTATLKFTVKLEPGYHTYPTAQVDEKAESYQSAFKFENTPDYVFVGDYKDPPGYVSHAEPEDGILELREYLKEVTWERKIVIRPDAKPGKTQVHWSIAQLSACNDMGCLLAMDLHPKAELTISDAAPKEVESQFRDEVLKTIGRGGNPDKPAIPPPGPPDGTRGDPFDPARGNGGKAAPPKPADVGPAVKAGNYAPASAAENEQAVQWVTDQLETQKAIPHNSLAFILAGIFWGAVSLVTPCVFPMIPITVSFFLKQSEKEHQRPVKMALVYCGTIVVVLTIAAVLLLSVFRYLSTNPYMNIGMGLLFVAFALSLFGMYELELPSGLARFTSSREGKGGLIGTMFMALTFTIVSFACVAPFLGGFGGTSAGSQITLLDRIFGGFAFAATFASPFFILALFPTLLKKLPRSGSWLNSVKVVMGFLELAAALVFFRTGELVLLPQPTLFTYDLVLGLWIAIIVLTGFYLLNFFRLPHDTPLEHLGVLRMLFGLLFIGLGFYLLPALFKHGSDGEKQRPNGVVYAWIDSFLLPESTGRGKGLPWGANLRKAVEEARTQSKEKRQHGLLLLDFTGESCKNCRYNENNVFTKPEIADLMRKYELVQLYTDKVPPEFYAPDVRDKIGSDVSRLRADARVNLDFQKKAFSTEQLPLYVILDPAPGGDDSKIAVVGMYSEGKINDDAAFAQFLKEPLSSAGQRAQAR